MTTLSVLTFSDPKDAEAILERIQALQQRHLIQLNNVAIVKWPLDGESKTLQLTDRGMAIGAARGIGAILSGRYWIDDHFTHEVKSKVKPGTSALIFTTSDVAQNSIVDALSDMQFEIISTRLSQEQEAALRADFGEEY